MFIKLLRVCDSNVCSVFEFESKYRARLLSAFVKAEVEVPELPFVSMSREEIVQILSENPVEYMTVIRPVFYCKDGSVWIDKSDYEMYFGD